MRMPPVAAMDAFATGHWEEVEAAGGESCRSGRASLASLDAEVS